jgi:hypothetical protein
LRPVAIESHVGQINDAVTVRKAPVELIPAANAENLLQHCVTDQNVFDPKSYTRIELTTTDQTVSKRGR